MIDGQRSAALVLNGTEDAGTRCQSYTNETGMFDSKKTGKAESVCIAYGERTEISLYNTYIVARGVEDRNSGD